MNATVEYKGMDIFPASGNANRQFFKLDLLSRLVIPEACQAAVLRDGEEACLDETKTLAGITDETGGFFLDVSPSGLALPTLASDLLWYADERCLEAEIAAITEPDQRVAEILSNKAKVATVIGLQWEALFKRWQVGT